MSTAEALEQRLTNAYRCQAMHYGEALRIANSGINQAELRDWAAKLQSALQQVAILEQNMAADKLAWNKSGYNVGVDLHEILTSVAAQIQSLAKAIDCRSKEVLEKKQRLLPALDEFIRHRHMLQSYGRYGKTK